MNIPRDTPLKKAIYACDELVGFIGACVKVRPTKKIADLPVESVVKKLKDRAFARSVDRSYVYGGADAIGRPLPEHVGFLIEALKPVADEIGLWSRGVRTASERIVGRSLLAERRQGTEVEGRAIAGRALDLDGVATIDARGTRYTRHVRNRVNEVVVVVK